MGRAELGVQQPISLATVNAVPVRFFPAPGEEPQMPWVAVDDLVRLVRMRDELRADLQRVIRQDFPEVSSTVATADGLELVGSFAMAIQLIDLFQDAAIIPLAVEDEFRAAAHAALTAHIADLPPFDKVAYAMTAIRRSS